MVQRRGGGRKRRLTKFSCGKRRRADHSLPPRVNANSWCGMATLGAYRSGKPGFYPDQAVYAEYACAESGLSFEELDGGSGLVFSVASADARVAFAAGRCSFFPQNSATAASLATDKY